MNFLPKIKNELAKLGIKPKKSLGQNFLINERIYKKIIDAAEIQKGNTVIEVGPGLGTLTQFLLDTGAEVLAIEKDHKLAEYLKTKFADEKRAKIIEENILGFQPQNYKLQITNYKIVGNIPYYLTSHLLRTVFEKWPTPKLVVLMIQKEVAQRIVAKPPNMSLLAVYVQFYADPKIISYVSKNCFWPSRKVDSAIIKITPRGQTSRQAGGQTSPDLFFRVVKAGFSQPRKQLSNNLSKILKMDRKKVNEWLSRNNIGSSQRAETLSIENWKNLTNSI